MCMYACHSVVLRRDGESARCWAHRQEGPPESVAEAVWSNQGMLVFHLYLLDFPVTDNNWTLQCREPGIASFLSPPRSVIFPVFILWSCMSWKQHRFCSTFAIQLKEDPNLCIDGTQRSETVGQNVRFSFLQLKHLVEAL